MRIMTLLGLYWGPSLRKLQYQIEIYAFWKIHGPPSGILRSTKCLDSRQDHDANAASTIAMSKVEAHALE